MSINYVMIDMSAWMTMAMYYLQNLDPILIDMQYKYYVGHDDFQGGAWVWRYVSFFGAHLTLHRLSGIKM